MNKDIDYSNTSVINEKSRVFGTSTELALSEIYSGFSERLNWLIDASDLKAPPLYKGRISWLAKITETSKSAVLAWLKKNKPPKSVFLRKLVTFLVAHLPPITKNIPTVEAWLKYGPEVIDVNL